MRHAEKRKMRYIFNHISGILLVIFLSSCREDVDFNKIIDSNSPFIISLNLTDSITGYTTVKTDTIIVGTDSWGKVVECLKNNSNDWNSTPASYLADFNVQQGEFGLMGWTEQKSVVIHFIDKNGKSKQLIKSIDNNKLDFLINLE